MADGKRQTTPTWTEVLRKAIEQRLCDIYTSMPGEVVEYDVNTGLATIKALLKRKYVGETDSIELPLISNVPICFPRMGKSRLRLPVAVGDEGQIKWQQRSIDTWLKTGGSVDPLDPRKFNLSDATFWPGLTSQANKPVLNGDPASLVLENDKGFIEILPSGKFKITNGSEEQFTILVDFLTEIIDEMLEQGTKDFTNTVFGPLQPVNFAAYTALKSKYEAIKGRLKVLKG